MWHWLRAGPADAAAYVAAPATGAEGEAVTAKRRLVLWRSHISDGNRNTNSKPIPQAGTVRIASQPSNGVPSSSSAVTHASGSPKAIPVSGVG